MSRYGRWPGTWAAICDRCGFRYNSDKLRKEWQGLMTCPSCWESRHPQDFVRGVPDDPRPPWVRPEGEDTFIAYCTLAGSSGYAGFGIAGCMIAGNDQFTPQFLMDAYGDSY
jgi:hypothetical protein